METKLRANRMEIVRVKLGFNHMFVVDCVSQSGGLALFWMLESGVKIQNFSRRHINAKVSAFSNDTPWKFTRFYDQPDASKRLEA